jgi:hypothetical protein
LTPMSCEPSASCERVRFGAWEQGLSSLAMAVHR